MRLIDAGHWFVQQGVAGKDDCDVQHRQQVDWIRSRSIVRHDSRRRVQKSCAGHERDDYFFDFPFTDFFFAAAVFFFVLGAADLVGSPPNALSQFLQNSGVVPVRTIGPPMITAFLCMTVICDRTIAAR